MSEIIKDELERRFLPGCVEIRTEGTEKPRVRGYAAKYGVESENLGGKRKEIRETIAKGAFDDVLQDDVRALFNHDANLVLARSKGGQGTLTLGTDETGLWYEFEAPDTQAGRDLLENIRLGNVDQSSFGFTVTEEGQAWEEKRDESGNTIARRTIKKISRLFDVSPVTYPAYPDATVALRSLESFQRESSPEEQIPSQEELSEVRDWAARLGLQSAQE